MFTFCTEKTQTDQYDKIGSYNNLNDVGFGREKNFAEGLTVDQPLGPDDVDFESRLDFDPR